LRCRLLINPVIKAVEGGLRTMFFYDYEPIKEENESKCSSQGDIRTDMSNTDESFVLDVRHYIDFCDDAADGVSERSLSSPGRVRALSEEQVKSTGSRELKQENPEGRPSQLANGPAARTDQTGDEGSKPVEGALQKRASFLESLRCQLSGDANN